MKNRTLYQEIRIFSMWSCVAEDTIPGVSKAPSAFVLKDQVVQEEGNSDNQIIPYQLFKKKL